MVHFKYVYVLRSLKKSQLYIGLTEKPLKKRLIEHDLGLTPSTKAYRPWILIHFEGYLHLKDAAHREQYLKSNKGARVLKLMLKSYFSSLSH